MSRPDWLDTLLDRPLPELHPRKLTDNSNEPWSREIRSKIADARVHRTSQQRLRLTYAAALESVLHLMNDDLFSAHFLLRKMQEDDWGKYLHGILHGLEGDSANQMCWIRDSPESIVAVYWGSSDPRRKAIAHVQRVALLSGKSIEGCEQMSKEAKVEAMADPPSEEGLDETAERKASWGELKSCLAELERIHGWQETDGTQAYTKDEGAMQEKKSGMLLGEGWRTF